MENNKFPISVIEKLGYYVYFLIDPTTTPNQVFYVGKGTGNRIFAHINVAISSPTENDKLDRIRSIHSQGKQVIHSIVRHGLTENEAFEVEAALIDYIEGLTNIVIGHHSDERGLMTISEIIAQYNAKPIDITEPVILVTVNRLFRRNMNDAELFEIARGDWVVGERRNKAKYVFCVAYGIVRQVYEIQEWFPSKARSLDSKTQDRWRLNGIVAKDLQHYVGGCVEKYIGAQNPIRYVNC